MTQWPISPNCNFSNLFPLKWFRITQNGQFCPIHNFSNLFPPKWLRMTWNSQFHPICNFSNLFPPKWLRMTQNGQFCMAKIKFSLIQGNFYERLPFYMDSCALSPMASLFSTSSSQKFALNFSKCDKLRNSANKIPKVGMNINN